MAELIGKNTVIVDLDKPLVRKNVGVAMASGDKLANRYGVQLFRNGAEVNVASSTVTGYMIMPNDETLMINGTASGNMVYVDIPESGYKFDGAFTLTIKITGNGMKKAVAIFDGVIARTTSDNIISGDRVLYGVEDILELIDTMEQAATDATNAAIRAGTEATKASASAASATAAAGKIDRMTVSSSDVGADASASAVITDDGTNKNIHFNLRQGKTPNLTFQVATGEPGTQVQISQSGTAENPDILLTIPRGDTGAVDGVDYFTGIPSALGTASPGTANGVARGDHVHPMPSAEDIGVDVDALAGSGMELIWENADASGTFSANPANLSDAYELSQYKGIVIVTLVDSADTNNWMASSGILPVVVGQKYRLSTTHDMMIRRGVTITSTTKITFGNSMKVSTYGSSAATTFNTTLVPMYIYGVR